MARRQEEQAQLVARTQGESEKLKEELKSAKEELSEKHNVPVPGKENKEAGPTESGKEVAAPSPAPLQVKLPLPSCPLALATH